VHNETDCLSINHNWLNDCAFGASALAPPGAKKRFREEWLPPVWDVARGNRPPTHWRGFPDGTDWETTHVALLRTTFRPTVEKAVVGFVAESEEEEEALLSFEDSDAKLASESSESSDARATRSEGEDEDEEPNTVPSLRRSWRRFYGAALGIDAAAPLTIENAPEAWSARGDKKGARAECVWDEDAPSRPRVVLTHRGRVVDTFAA
jgi:hypothetical protein